MPRSPRNSVQMPAKANKGRPSLSANHTTSLFLVSGFGSGAYSEKQLAGTRQRFSGFNQPLQCGEIARKFRGRPVQTIWSRAEDIRDDVYRPGAMADVAATLDAKGQPTSFVYRIAVPSVSDQFAARAMPSAKGGLMGIARRSTARSFHYIACPIASRISPLIAAPYPSVSGARSATASIVSLSRARR